MINIREVFNDYGIELSNLQIEQFSKYYDLLIKYNNVMNLTAITEYDEVIVKHFLDSVLPYKNITKGAKVIDVGTGAGFPAIPLKIVRDDLCITLVDSLNKRINFLNAVISGLQLKNITAIHSRSEDLARGANYRGQFDYCLSRAVAKLPTLLELCTPFIKVGATFLAYKGSGYSEEINLSENALKLLSCKIQDIENYELPKEYGSRTVIIVKKVKNTNKIYPRKNNLPKNKPL